MQNENTAVAKNRIIQTVSDDEYGEKASYESYQGFSDLREVIFA